MNQCKDCRFWKPTEEDPEIGECRRTAPKVVSKPAWGVILFGFGFISGSITTRWPETLNEDGCGQYQGPAPENEGV